MTLIHTGDSDGTSSVPSKKIVRLIPFFHLKNIIDGSTFSLLILSSVITAFLLRVFVLSLERTFVFNRKSFKNVVAMITSTSLLLEKTEYHFTCLICP